MLVALRFEGVYSERDMVQTTTNTAETSSHEPRKAGGKGQEEINDDTDAVLKCEGRHWSGTVAMCVGFEWHEPIVKYVHFKTVLKST